MKLLLSVLVLLFASAFLSKGAYAQQEDFVRGGVLELDVIKVEVKVEEPRVTITKSRKKPEFNYIELEKNFNVELLAILKSIKYHSVTSGKVQEIPDIDLLIDKNRRVE